MESRRASSASKPTTGEATEAGFVSDLHDVRTGYLLHDSIAQPMRSPLGGCVSGVSGVPLLLCGAPISVCGSPSWEVEECPPATMLLVNVSACEEAHHQSGVSPPLLGLEALEINGWMGLLACTPYMCVHATAVGFRSRSLGGASGFPPPGSVSRHSVSRRRRRTWWCGPGRLAGIIRCLADCCRRPLLKPRVDVGGRVGGPSLQSSR